MKESLLYITRKTKGIGGMQRLSHDFIRKMLELIHQESILIQNKVMNNGEK